MGKGCFIVLVHMMMLSVKNEFVYVCSEELTRLWNLCPDNMEACKSETRQVSNVSYEVLLFSKLQSRMEPFFSY